MEQKKDINLEEITPESISIDTTRSFAQAQTAENQVLSQMAEQEEGEFNSEEPLDDITHDLRISKTRRG